MWTKRQIEQHRAAARALEHIEDAAFGYIRTHRDCTERAVQLFILEQYRKHGLKSALGRPIVAFGPSAVDPHHDPSKHGPRRLARADVVEIDVWARLDERGAPFADITWVGYVGKRIPRGVREVFDTVIRARDASVRALRRALSEHCLPSGREGDAAAMRVLLERGYRFRREILHTTGHSLGTASPHGIYGGIRAKNIQPLKKNLGYTIEPGIYVRGRFGIRSEINVYISSDWKLIHTTRVQRHLRLL